MQLDVLAIGVHPDDVELGCGGTIAKLTSQGKKVGVLDLTRGELGTRGSAELRDVEAKNAAKVLNLSARENLAFKDGFFKDDEEHQLKIIEIIRKYKPEIVLCNAPQDRHPDHGRAAKLTTTACFLSGLRKIYTGQEAWRPKKVFHFIQWEPLTPDFIFDISGFIDKKIESCLVYKTQFYNPNSNEPETPISSKNFTESIRYRAQDLGRLINVDAGEGFIKSSSSFLGVNGFDSFL